MKKYITLFSIIIVANYSVELYTQNIAITTTDTKS